MICINWLISLFPFADDLGKAVEELVTVMTSDDANTAAINDDDEHQNPDAQAN